MVVVQTVVLKVAMTCGGCVGAVKRAIGKLDGTPILNLCPWICPCMLSYINLCME
jgi:copper chaperone CopZ